MGESGTVKTPSNPSAADVDDPVVEPDRADRTKLTGRSGPPVDVARDGAAGTTTAWVVARVLLVGAAILLVLTALSALRPVENPGVQDCGGPVPFLVLNRENRVIHNGDTGAPEEGAHAAQPTCRARALDEAGRSGRLFAGFLVLAGLGATIGLIDDRLAYRRAPRYETLLRPLPIEARAQRGLVPRVTVDELEVSLPPVEGPEIAGIIIWSAVALVGLPLAGSWDATMAALSQVRPGWLALGAVVMVATWAAAAELRLSLLPTRRPGTVQVDDGHGDAEAQVVAALVAVAGSWLAAVRPLMSSMGLDLHRLRRRGVPRGEAVADVEVLETVSLVLHLSLLAPVALAVALDRHPPAVVRESQLALIGIVVVGTIMGSLRLRTRWRGLPVRPSWRAFTELDRLAPGVATRARAIGLTLAQPLLRAMVLSACLSAFGAGPPVIVVVFVALMAPVAVALAPTPAGAGMVEGVTMLLLMLLAGVDPGRAAAVTLAARALTYWLPMIPGLAASRRLRRTGVL